MTLGRSFGLDALDLLKFIHSFIVEMITSYQIFRKKNLALCHRSEECWKLWKKEHKTLILLLSKCPPNFLIPKGSPPLPPIQEITQENTWYNWLNPCAKFSGWRNPLSQRPRHGFCWWPVIKAFRRLSVKFREYENFWMCKRILWNNKLHFGLQSNSWYCV
jgi:hypothetical protein